MPQASHDGPLSKNAPWRWVLRQSFSETSASLCARREKVPSSATARASRSTVRGTSRASWSSSRTLYLASLARRVDRPPFAQARAGRALSEAIVLGDDAGTHTDRRMRGDVAGGGR